jgi:hypothetical protein
LTEDRTFQQGQVAEGRKYTENQAANQFKNLRKSAEAGGFNPLLALGQSQPVFSGMANSGPSSLAVPNGVSPGQFQSNNYIGAAIAESGLMFADSMANISAASAPIKQLSEQNAQLQQKVQDLTLRPSVGGIYAQRLATPSLRQALGAGDDKNASDINSQSPFARPATIPDDGNRSPVQRAVKKDVPAFRAFGHDFYGSGAFSSGEQYEEALGEGPLQWLSSPLIMGDAFLNEAYKTGRNLGLKHNTAFKSGGVSYAPMPEKFKLFERVGRPHYQHKKPSKPRRPFLKDGSFWSHYGAQFP